MIYLVMRGSYLSQPSDTTRSRACELITSQHFRNDIIRRYKNSSQIFASETRISYILFSGMSQEREYHSEDGNQRTPRSFIREVLSRAYPFNLNLGSEVVSEQLYLPCHLLQE